MSRYWSPLVEKLLMHRDAAVTNAPPLSRRQMEIAQCLAHGMSNREIAQHLSVSVKTVDTHRRRIMKKLGVDGVAELTKYAIREGLVSLDA